MSVDTIDDFALFGIGVGGDGEAWACGNIGDFGTGRARRGSDSRLWMGRIGEGGGWIHERDGGGTELCSGGDDLSGVAEDVNRCGGRGHVVVV